MEELDINGDNFNTIYADIKERYLSRTSFPKIIVGTGLSISFGVAGMVGLSDKLEKKSALTAPCRIFSRFHF